MIKVLACVCFIVGSVGFGYIKVTEYAKHYEELVYIKHILNCMKIEIENGRGTFGETCLTLAKKLSPPYRDIFQGLYELLERARNKNPYTYWSIKINELAGIVCLKKDEEEILQGVIRCADGTTIATPLEVIKESIVEWDKAIRSAEQVRKERSKVTLCLSITVGLLLCITVI